jgi:hypothetical protein
MNIFKEKYVSVFLLIKERESGFYLINNDPDKNEKSLITILCLM